MWELGEGSWIIRSRAASATDNQRRSKHSCHSRPHTKLFALYGGDDGARTRDLCRDSEPENCN